MALVSFIFIFTIDYLIFQKLELPEAAREHYEFLGYKYTLCPWTEFTRRKNFYL